MFIGNRLQLETDLKIEREWRQTLQNDLERERETVAQLSAEARQINGLKKVNFILHSAYAYMTQCKGYVISE